MTPDQLARLQDLYSSTPTNVYELYRLQREANDIKNTFYYSGVGAQTVASGTLLPDGRLHPASSPSS